MGQQLFSLAWGLRPSLDSADELIVHRAELSSVDESILVSIERLKDVGGTLDGLPLRRQEGIEAEQEVFQLEQWLGPNAEEPESLFFRHLKVEQLKTEIQFQSADDS